MGYWKDKQIEDAYRIYDSLDTYVCPECVTDDILRAAVQAKLEAESCSYCDAESAAEISVLLDMVRDVLHTEYTDPADQLMWNGREGGYLGEVLDGDDVVRGFDEWTENDELLEDVANAFAGSQWTEREYYGTGPFRALNFGWSAFVTQIRDVTRFLFLQELGDENGDPAEIPPARMLEELGKLFQKYRLFSCIPASTELVRARITGPNEFPKTVDDVGPPPRQASMSPNRMSPAGIPMFYAALDEKTAVLETWDSSLGHDRVVTLARFKALRDLNVLDLTDLPGMPSQFDKQEHPERAPIGFLHSFVWDFCKPIERTASAYAEYAPTQAVTEYVRHRLKTNAGHPIDGIIYNSSRHAASVAVVLFAEARDCGPRTREFLAQAPFLELQSVRHASPSEFAHAIHRTEVCNPEP